jgi:hypothetical protein
MLRVGVLGSGDERGDQTLFRRWFDAVAGIWFRCTFVRLPCHLEVLLVPRVQQLLRGDELI